MASMFEILMNLPLFRGVSHDKLAQVVGEAKFHFLKYPAGEPVVREGENCTHITFVISGAVRTTIENPTGRFAVSQTLTAPAVIAPQFLFGRKTTYPGTAEAIEPTGILKISKNDYINILNRDHVFLFNYLNTLSVSAQTAISGLMSLTSGSIEERIAYWIVALTQSGGKDITLTCRKRDLCSLFGTQRATFESALASMKERGLIDYTNKELTVLSRSGLLALLVNNSESQDDND